MKVFSTSLLTFLISIHAFANLLSPSGKSEKSEKVSIFPSASVNLEGESLALTSVGTGLRAKKVVFLNVKVYVGQLFLSSPDLFKRSEAEALGSLKEQKVVAIQLHFLRDVDSESVQKSFKEALSANKIDLNDKSIQQFLDFVAKGGEAKDGKSLTILGAHLKDGSESIFYESNNGTASEVKGSAGFIEKIFAIWLGNPVDDGVANLKKSILKK